MKTTIKTVILAFAAMALLTGCQKKEDIVYRPPISITASGITGAPPFGNTVVRVYIARGSDTDMSRNREIARVPFTNGAFSVTLDANMVLNDEITMGYDNLNSEGIHVSNPLAKYAMLIFALYLDDEYLGLLVHTNGPRHNVLTQGTSRVRYVFFNQPCVLSGSYTKEEYTYSYDQRFSQGWGISVREFPARRTIVCSNIIPEGLGWKFFLSEEYEVSILK